MGLSFYGFEAPSGRQPKRIESAREDSAMQSNGLQARSVLCGRFAVCGVTSAS